MLIVKCNHCNTVLKSASKSDEARCPCGNGIIFPDMFYFDTKKDFEILIEKEEKEETRDSSPTVWFKAPEAIPDENVDVVAIVEEDETKEWYYAIAIVLKGEWYNCMDARMFVGSTVKYWCHIPQLPFS